MLTKKNISTKAKGGIIICLSSQDSFPALKEQLLNKLSAFNDLVGVNVILDVGERKLTQKESQELRKILMEKGMHLKRLISRGKSQDFDEPVKPEEEDNILTMREEEISFKETMLIRRTMRSGQTVAFRGNIVVLGDVNPGAEIIAGGNIIIIGSMRGLAHAGAEGSEKSVVVALRMNPTQLRIANHITRPPEGEAMAGNEPEIALIRDGKVVIDKLKV